MPTNKNAFIRYKYLDRLLSDYHHYYDIHDLTDKVNEMLYSDGFPIVTQRCIEKDLNTLEFAPFNAPIERFKKDGKSIIIYGNRSFTIFSEALSKEEVQLLREVLNTIGQFDGLDNFKWLDKFKIGLGMEEKKPIISFSNNPYLTNSNLLGTLFDFIANEVVIKLSYHTFSDVTIRSIAFHPYLLKQYNDRWYVLGAADEDMKILHFALDRVDRVEPLPEKKFCECPEDLSERFENIVGVTLYEDLPVRGPHLRRRDACHAVCRFSARRRFARNEVDEPHRDEDSFHLGGDGHRDGSAHGDSDGARGRHRRHPQES